MATKPLINIEVDVSVRRSYALSAEAAKVLEDYADFLSDLATKDGANKAKKKAVTPGQVIGKLTERLSKDSLFLAWQKASASAEPAAKTKAASKAKAAVAEDKAP